MSSASSSISVIVPVYNATRFLERAVASICAQTPAIPEIVLVDDGSTDDSLALCRRLAAGNRRITVRTQENQGPAAARNTGVGAASGHWISFVDADDLLPPGAIAVLLESTRASASTMVMGNFNKHEISGKVIPQNVTLARHQAPLRSLTADLDRGGIARFVRHFLRHPSNHLASYCWARLYHHETIRQHQLAAHPQMRLFEDYVFNLDYWTKSPALRFVNHPVYTYTMHTSHLSASMAPIRAERLLHDMAAFRERTDAFLAGLAPRLAATPRRREIGHALIHYLIIFLVRTCRSPRAWYDPTLLVELRRLVDAPLVREALRAYRPATGNSRLIPLLLRAGLVRPLTHICHLKALRRYGPIDATVV